MPNTMTPHDLHVTITCTYIVLYVTLLYCCYLMQHKATPVWVAALNGKVRALNVLIRANANVNAANGVSLMFILHEIIFIVQIINFSEQKANRRGSICYMYVYLYPQLLPCVHMHSRVMRLVALVNKKQAV